MAKPVIVIVGRPNVGKSTLFNRIVGSRKAVVEAIPGVTRDANYAEAQWEEKAFVVVDTGGFFPETEEDIYEQVREQALFAVEEASLIVHLLDGKEGLMASDSEITGILRSSGKKVISVVNKIDGPTREERLYDFYPLGLDELVPVSAETGYGFDEMMDKLVFSLPPAAPETAEHPKVAVVGRPNVGKSTLINTLLGKRRLIVSPVGGTTRDSIDTICTYYGKKYLFIDTAGIRRKSKAGYSVERFSVLRSLMSIERCDVALFLIDSEEGIVADDQKIAGFVHDYGKGVVVLFNKWDLVKDHDEARRRLAADVERKLWFISHAPRLTVSGLEKKRVTKVFPLIDGVLSERRKKIGRAELNRFLEDVLGDSVLPAYKGKKVKIFYMEQVATEPPRFTLHTDSTEALKGPFMRYVERRLRERYSFGGTPVIIMKRRRR